MAAGDAAARAGTSVVLAAAGSSDPAANATIAELAARWARERGWRAVVPCYASAAGPRPAEAVRALRAGGAARVAVATYLLAPGYFADKVSDAALGAGADAVSGVLGAAPEVADLVLDRYLAAAAVPVGHGARAVRRRAGRRDRRRGGVGAGPRLDGRGRPIPPDTARICRLRAGADANR